MAKDMDSWLEGYEAAQESRMDSLSCGTACFLVKDASLSDINAEFFTWLREQGFRIGKPAKGHFDNVDWVYVNLNSKKYGPGMPGVALTEVISNHAVTLDEFKTIYDIYEKYKGKAPLKF